MYQNAGKSIKSVVTVCVVILMVLSVIGGLVIMAQGGSGVIIGLLAMAIGCFSAWLSGLMLYAFGEITDRMISVQETLEIMEDRMSRNAQPSAAPVSRPSYSAPASRPAYGAPAANPANNTDNIPTWKRIQMQQEAQANAEAQTYCTVCGHNNAPGTRFCVKCGYELKK